MLALNNTMLGEKFIRENIKGNGINAPIAIIMMLLMWLTVGNVMILAPADCLNLINIDKSFKNLSLFPFLGVRGLNIIK
jgi:hypothetical protein